MVDLENQEFCCLFPPVLLPGNSSRLVHCFPSYCKYWVGFEVFFKRMWTEHTSRAPGSSFPATLPSPPGCGEQQGQTCSLGFLFVFLNSSVFAGLDGVRGSVSCFCQWALMCTLITLLYLLHTEVLTRQYEGFLFMVDGRCLGIFFNQPWHVDPLPRVSCS